MADFLGGGNDDIDFDKAASAFPDISLDGIGDIPAVSSPPDPVATSTPGGFSFDDFDGPPTPKDTNVKVTGDDDISKFESEFPDIEVPSQPAPAPSFGEPTIAPKPQPSAFTSTPILSQTLEEDEPEVIKEWRERQQEEIKQRDEQSKAKRQETLSAAERAIDEFYENYARKKERNIRDNKDQEEEYLSKLNASLSNGTTWERICDTVELQNSQSKTLARAGPGTTDLTRFKEVLLRLKREGASAPGAAGY